MTDFLLHLRDATKVADGSYTWSFSARNLVRPKELEVGPCSITVSTDQRDITILSDSFRNNKKTHTLRGDSLHNVLTVVHPEQRYSRKQRQQRKQWR